MFHGSRRTLGELSKLEIAASAEDEGKRVKEMMSLEVLEAAERVVDASSPSLHNDWRSISCQHV